MAGKTYNYDVRIRASLDTSKMSGAGSTVKNQVDRELNQAYEEGLNRRQQKTKASLDLIDSWEQQHSDKVKREQADYTNWWGQELDKRSTKQRASLEDIEKKDVASKDKRRKQEQDYTSWWGKELDKRDNAEQKLLNNVVASRKKVVANSISTSDLIKDTDATIKSIQRKTDAVDKYNKIFERSQRPGANQFTQNALSKAEKDAFEAPEASGSKTGRSFGNAFRGAVIGALTGFMVGVGIGIVEDFLTTLGKLAVTSVQLAGDFQLTTNAMAVFSGTTSLAKKELADIDDTARKTPGLRLLDAEQGTLRLRALGFSAKTTKDLVVGLAKEKLLSGADEQAMNRVIINITQLASGSHRVSQDIREMVQAMPTMRNALIDSFGSIDKFERALRNDPKATFAKFADYLKSVQSPAAGFNDALGKMEDEFTKAGRVFGDPILKPLTDGLQSVTQFLAENKDTWKEWGEYVANILRGASAAFSFINNPLGLSSNQKKRDDGTIIRDNATRFGDAVGSYGLSFLFGGPIGVGIKGGLDSLAQAGKYKDEEERKANLAADLLTIEKNLAAGLTYTDDQMFDEMASLAEDNSDTVARIAKDKALNLQMVNDKAREKELASQQRAYEAERKLTEEFIEWQTKQMSVFNNRSLAGLKGSLQNADTSTPGRAAAVNAQNYSVATQDITNQIGLLTNKRRITLEGFYDKNGIFHKPLEKDDAEKTVRDIDLQIQDLISKIIEGQIGRLNQVAQENKTANEAYLKGSRLSLTTGNAQIDSIIRSASSSRGLNPNIIAAIVGQESGGKNGLTSWAGAGGLMQLMQGTARSLGVTNVNDPSQNINAGALLLSRILSENGGHLDWALAEYNTGHKIRTESSYQQMRNATNIKKYQSLPFGQRPYGGSTGEYVDRIMKRVRGGTEVDTSVEFGQFDFSGQSDTLTKSRDRADTLAAVEGAFRLGIRPSDEQIQVYQQILAEDAQKKGAVQPRYIDTLKKFNGLLPFPTLSENQNVYGRRQSFLTDDVEKNTQEQQRLDDRRSDTYGEILVKQRAYELSLGNALQDEKVESGLLERRNTSLETTVEYEKQRNQLTRDLGDVERDLSILNQQNENREFVSDRRRLAAKREQLDLEHQITDVTDQMANSGQNDQLKITLALLQQQLDILNEHVDAQITIKKSQVEINRMMEVRTDVIDAKVMDHLAQQKNMTDTIADGIIDIYEGIAGPMEKGIDKLTSKLGIFSGLVGGVLKTAGRSTLTHITTGILDNLGLGGFANEINNQQNPVMAGLDKQDEQIKWLKQIATNTGGGPGLALPSVTGFGRGSFGIPGLGGLRSFGGPGGFGTYTTPPFAGGSGGNILDSLLSSGVANTVTDLSGRAVSTGGPAQGRGGFFGSLGSLLGFGGAGGFGASVASSLPFLGLSLGAGLGSGSGVGSILGGAGGLALGTIGFGLAAPGLAGTVLGGIFGSSALGALAPLLFNPFTAIAAGALIPLAIILGIQARRKQAEKQRSVLRDNAGTELDKLISQVRGHRMSPDDALSQAEQIKADYTQQVSQLKDGKTRRIAMNEWNQPNVLWQKMEQLKKEGEMADSDTERNKRILPEFADGGYIRARRGGTMAILGEGGHDEVVLSSDPSKASRTAQLLSGFLANYAPATASGGSAPSITQPITIYVSHEIDANGMVATAIQTDGVKKEMVKVINKDLINNGLLNVVKKR